MNGRLRNRINRRHRNHNVRPVDQRRFPRMTELIPYWFYVAGSLCFLIGSLITIAQKLS